MHRSDKLFVIAIFGPAGTGKTTLAEILKNQLVNTAHVSSDHIKRYISQFKEIPSHNKASRNVTDAMVAEYLKNGISTIVEQGMSAAEITTLETIAKNHDANFFVYRIEASNETRIKRIQERATRTNQPMMSQETMNTLSEIYENNAYPATGTFNSEKMTIKEIAEQILKDIGARKNQ